MNTLDLEYSYSTGITGFVAIHLSVPGNVAAMRLADRRNYSTYKKLDTFRNNHFILFSN